jgi:hypothetical protein
MRQTLDIALAVLLALSAAGCGDLENEPFLTGTVHGQLTESEQGVALVSVIGSPQLFSTVAPDGTFTLEHVPAGQAELFIVASQSKTLRQRLVVQGGQSVSVGLLAPREASFLSVHVKAPAHQSVAGARVFLAGTPVEQLALDETKRLLLGPLPDGCYSLGVALTNFPAVESQTCVEAGEHKEVKVELPAPASGCSVTGCAQSFLCAQSGQCVECLQDEQCGAGLSCRNSRCEDGPVCTACEGDWKCRAGMSCQEVPDGGRACVEKCTDGDECDEGFTCQTGRCLPDAAQFSGCSAYRGMGAACSADESCRDLGLVNGVCQAAQCTFRCNANQECPADYSCQVIPGGRMCLPEP